MTSLKISERFKKNAHVVVLFQKRYRNIIALAGLDMNNCREYRWNAPVNFKNTGEMSKRPKWTKPFLHQYFTENVKLSPNLQEKICDAVLYGVLLRKVVPRNFTEKEHHDWVNHRCFPLTFVKIFQSGCFEKRL